MKLNFWQWIGVAIIIVGLILVIRKYAMTE